MRGLREAGPVEQPLLARAGCVLRWGRRCACPAAALPAALKPLRHHFRCRSAAAMLNRHGCRG
eukprot:10032975-Alexandrium_andersonii.AAC.1